jgi:hypothetical protein
MPRQSLKNQKGSILVGVILLSLAMTIAAAGFLLYVSNGSKDMDLAAQDIALHNAAESGMLMGVRWLREHPKADLMGGLVDVLLTDTAGEYTTLDGYQIKVWLKGNPNRLLQCIATKGFGEDSLGITWHVEDDVRSGPDSLTGPLRSSPNLTNWTETLKPGYR